VLHHGQGLGRGHYTSVCKVNSQHWIHWDDSSHRMITETEALQMCVCLSLHFLPIAPVFDALGSSALLLPMSCVAFDIIYIAVMFVLVALAVEGGVFVTIIVPIIIAIVKILKSFFQGR
jgi:hypothetical protein